MPAGNAHRQLAKMYDAFTPGVAAGLLLDPGSGGTMTPTLWGMQCPVVTLAAEARTLAQPARAGILFSVALDADGGDLTLTVTGGYNNAGDTAIVFGDVGDMVVFLSRKEGTSYYWTAISEKGTDAVVDTPQIQSLTGAAAVTVNGTVDVASIDSGGAYAITLAAPSAAMRGKTLVIEYSQGTTNAVTLALTNVQGGSAATSASFNADNETLILVGGESKWNVVGEIGVTLS